MKAKGLTGIILCGGSSSRMGSDKGLMQYRNKTLIEYAIGSIKPFCSNILLSTNNKAYSTFGYTLIPDTEKNIGPLAGIYSGLLQIKTDYCLVTACDIPQIEHSLLNQMIAESGQKLAVLLKLPTNYFQPFPVILSKHVLPLVKNQIKNWNYKLQDLYQQIEQQLHLRTGIVYIESEPVNINNPEDLL